MRPRLKPDFTLVVIALTIAGCGDSNSSSPAASEPDTQQLVERVPPDFQLIYADLAAVREELKLPDDADPEAVPRGRRDTEFVAAVRPALHYLLNPNVASVAEEVLDHGAVTAAASNVVFGVPGVTVLRTTQPFDEIARQLEERGYERDGDIVELDRGFINTDHSVFADAGEGIIVLGWVRETVDRALSDSPAADSTQLEQIGRVKGAVRAAVTRGLAPCMRGVAAGKSFDPESAELRIEVEGEASAARLQLPPLVLPPADDFGPAKVDGGSLTIEARNTRFNPFAFLVTEPPIYDCG